MPLHRQGRPASGALVPAPSATPDPARERPSRFWDPSRKLLRALRDYQRPGPLAPLRRPFAVLRHRFWSAVTGCDLPLNTTVGVGLQMPHPAGIVVHPDTEIGANCLLMQNVTLGTNGGPGVPRLGPRVDVGPGAVVLGPISIGEAAVIGANAVVLQDVPPGATAVGVPARILPARGDDANRAR